MLKLTVKFTKRLGYFLNINKVCSSTRYVEYYVECNSKVYQKDIINILINTPYEKLIRVFKIAEKILNSTFHIKLNLRKYSPINQMPVFVIMI